MHHTGATIDLIFYKKNVMGSLIVGRAYKSIVEKIPRLIEEIFVPFNLTPCKNRVICIIIWAYTCHHVERGSYLL